MFPYYESCVHFLIELKETIRLAGEFKLNVNIFEDEKLVNILNKASVDLQEFNKNLADYLSEQA